ncbi:MAG: hypothetical protein HC771_23675, partial [Synechococcales cyanobacterium CRU_2_2]|nr:hypothetical protein [Synechococcales cyanobacterium CRU_2_2]
RLDAVRPRIEQTQTGQANRTVVGYKYYFDPQGASNPSLTTYLWREPPLNRPEAALIGVMYDYNSLDSDIVKLATGSILLLTRQGFNHKDAGQKQQSEQILQKVRSVGAKYFAAGGGFVIVNRHAARVAPHRPHAPPSICPSCPQY